MTAALRAGRESFPLGKGNGVARMRLAAVHAALLTGFSSTTTHDFLLHNGEIAIDQTNLHTAVSRAGICQNYARRQGSQVHQRTYKQHFFHRSVPPCFGRSRLALIGLLKA